MPALPQATRYANYDTSVVYFVPTIADPGLAATRAEIDAGTDLTGEISDASGWTVSGAEIDAPDLKSEFVNKVPGRTSAENSSFTFYADEAGNDVRDVLPYKTSGFIVIMNGGYVAGQPMDVFPVRVRTAASPTLSVGDDLARISVGFSITREPALNLPIPAAGP
jgi:hypothetical protein